MNEKVKCLTVRQPYASLIIHGNKPVENRTWRTGWRGPLLIHAAKKWDKPGGLDIVERRLITYQHLWLCSEYGARGAIIGQVNLVDCVRDSDSEWAEDGMWHWVFADPIAFEEPIPYRGRQGLWSIDAAELEAAKRRI